MYLSVKNLPLINKGKFAKRWTGPFKILKVISPVAYRLELPIDWLQRRVHDVFHVSLLKTHVESQDFIDRPNLSHAAPMINADEDIRVPERIVRQRQSPTDPQQTEYLVRWKHKNPSDDTWEVETAFMDTDADTYEVLEQWTTAYANKRATTTTRAGRQSQAPSAFWEVSQSD